jgi:hypothetical protein
MRRLIDVRVLMLGILWCAVGCGTAGTSSQGEDGLTMAFVTFDSTNITQPDQVGDTAAQVDICPGVCGAGTIIDEANREPFSSTAVNAVFVNRGKADIVVDSYTLNVPDSGVPPVTRRISARLIGGRCLGADIEKQCAIDSDCGFGTCAHRETSFNMLLYDFDFKQRVRQGDCPFNLEPLTLDAQLVFNGTDEADNHYTIHTSYVSTFDNFDNCQNQ